jgi:hypothetical protein
MTRRRAIILIGIVAGLLIAWLSRYSYWDDITIPAPLKGEARTNPFYAAQHLAEALGARTAWGYVFTGAPAGSVVVLSSWHWDLSASRRQALEAWVEGGGRLVIDQSVVSGTDTLRSWTGIRQLPFDSAKREELFKNGFPEECRTVRESAVPGRAKTPDDAYSLCGLSMFTSLIVSGRRPTWSLVDGTGVQAARVTIGRGTVTMLNGDTFGNRELLEGDNGRLLVVATDLRRGDEVQFLTEQDHPSLLTLAWDYGGPAVALSLAVIGLALWRGAVRLGTLAAPEPSARRSLVEQIRGTGQFALRHGHGEALHAAMLRALDEAAQHRVAGYARLSHDQRFSAIATLAGFELTELATALAPGGDRRPRGLRAAIAVLETARRRTLIEGRRARHGRD